MTEQIVDDGTAITVCVDGICTVAKIGSVTHLVFTSRRPEVCGQNAICRKVEVRMVVPNDCLQAIGRLILSGEYAPHQSEIEDMSDRLISLQYEKNEGGGFGRPPLTHPEYSA